MNNTNKIIFLILGAVIYSYAAFDLFPVPEGSGGSIRLSNTIFAINKELDEDEQNYIAGRHVIEARYYFNNFEMYTQLSGMHWDSYYYSEYAFGFLDIALGLRYKIHPNINVFMDLDGIPFGADQMNIRYLKLGLQFGGVVNKRFTVGSEIGLKNPFERDLLKSGRGKESTGVKIDQGSILNLTGEVDVQFNRIIAFLYLNLEVQIYDSEFNSPKRSYQQDKDGSGNGLFEFIYGVCVAINPLTSIEFNQGFKFGKLRKLSYEPNYVLSLGVNLKRNF